MHLPEPPCLSRKRARDVIDRVRVSMTRDATGFSLRFSRREDLGFSRADGAGSARERGGTRGAGSARIARTLSSDYLSE